MSRRGAHPHMTAQPRRRRSLIAFTAPLLAWSAACSPNASEERAGGNLPPEVIADDDNVFCQDGESCEDESNQPDNNPTGVTTAGEGTVVFGEEVGGGGGIRLSGKMDILFVVDNSVSMGDKQQIF